MSPTRAGFGSFFDTLGLRHFSRDEVLVAVGTHADRPDNPVPDEVMWRNAVPTLLVLDALRDELGRPIVLNSGFRAPDYNRAVGGGARSQHQDFRAFDFRCVGRSPDTCAEVLRRWRGKPFASPVPVNLRRRHAPLDVGGLRVNHTGQGTAFVFAGGIGTYDTFVHVDCRGMNHNWRGS